MDELVVWEEAPDFAKLGALALTYKGQTCFILKEVGKLWGYADEGRSFQVRVTQEWKEKIVVGKHLLKVEGEELIQLKVLFIRTTLFTQPEYTSKAQRDLLKVESFEEIDGSTETQEEKDLQVGQEGKSINSRLSTARRAVMEPDGVGVGSRVQPKTNSLLLITAEGLTIAAELSQKPEAIRFDEHVQLLLEKRELERAHSNNSAISHEKFLELFNTSMKAALYQFKIETGEAVENAVNEIVDRYRAEFEPEPPRGEVATELLRLKNWNLLYTAGLANEKILHKIIKESEAFKAKGALILKNLAEEVTAKLDEWEKFLMRAYIAHDNSRRDWETTHDMALEKRHQEKALWFKNQESRVLSEFMELRDKYIASYELLEDQVYCAALGYQDPAKPPTTPEELEEAGKPYRRCWTRTEDSEAVWNTIDMDRGMRIARRQRAGRDAVKYVMGPDPMMDKKIKG